MVAKRRYTADDPANMSKRYASDLTDAEWAILAPLVVQKPGSGKPRTVNIREILNALFYRLRTGCQWRMLPKEFPPWNHVWYYYRSWRNDATWDHINTALRQEIRVANKRDAEPSVAVLDSQSVKTTEMGGEKGFDPHKRIKGRKRHILVDTLGLILFVVVSAASIQDSDGAEYLLEMCAGRFPRLKRILVDQGYASWLVERAFQCYGLIIDIVRRPPGQKGFVVQPQRWKVEQTYGWLQWERLLSREHERTLESSESDIYVASIRLMLRKLNKLSYAK